jgi:hypothetical protein
MAGSLRPSCYPLRYPMPNEPDFYQLAKLAEKYIENKDLKVQ